MGANIIPRTREDDELWIKKDEVFCCTETPSIFILFAHLQVQDAGYKRNSIEIINIKEEGRSEGKPIQKLVIIGEVMLHNHQEQILGFKKTFKIPNVMVPDQIKAKYNEDEYVLKIWMPKFVKQICGVQIEEVKEQEFEESIRSHKAIKEFRVHLIMENPKYGESDDEREEDGKEETEEVENIVIQSLEESHNGGLRGSEEDEEIIEGTEEEEEEEDISEEDKIEERKGREIEDRDVEVEEGTEMNAISNSFVDEEEGFDIEESKEALDEVVYESDVTEGEEETENIEEPMLLGHVRDEEAYEEGSGAKKTQKRVAEAEKKADAFEEATPNEEKGKTYNTEECGNQESQAPKKKKDSDAKLLRSSQLLESPLGHEIEVEASEEEEKANDERDGIYMEILKERDELVEDIRVEAREEDEGKEQRDEVYVEISSLQGVQERRESQFKDNEERKKSQYGALLVAGSAFVVSLVVFLVRQRRSVGKK